MDESYLSVLPPELCAGIRSLAARERAALQEIRLRCGQTASCLIDGRERVVPSGTKGYYVEPKCLEAIVNKATGSACADRRYAAREASAPCGS